ncbi:Uncharacterised protein [uncultured archaeon]|nr:Uncharacterised protein [uncultured archaeon]
MKGVILVVSVLAIALMGVCGTVLANPPLVPPVQYEQFCEAQKVSGTGVVDVSTSIVDKKIALEYYNTMAGDGDLELDSEHAYSQDADKLKRNVSSVNSSKAVGLNLYESSKMTYSGATPLTGGKYLHSKAFYGGIGADVQEMFSVNQMESDETSFFASTTPYRPQNVSPDGKKHAGWIDPDKLTKGGLLKNADRDTNTVEEMMTSYGDKNSSSVYVPSHLIGMETKNSFNGTWGTDAKWHKIFYKDIKAHEMFTGTFEAEKTIKFHENPVPDKIHAPCEGIDC